MLTSKGPASERWENEGGQVSSPEAPPKGLAKKLLIFDLDGTLAESKSSLDPEMAELLITLMGLVKVAVISGGDWPQFQPEVWGEVIEDRG